MNREIKFRAWDKKRKLMVRDDDEIYGHPVEPMSVITTIWTENSNEFSLRESEDIVYMQYTGLKDKNGKEIYEGDIVEYLDYGSHSYSDDGRGYLMRKAECKYSPFTACFYFKCDDSDEHTYRELLSDQEKFARERESASSAYRNGKFCPELQSIEIIGNIYENPELLQSN